MNPRQERFCHAFVEYGCAAVAAVQAGYNRPTSRQQGWRLLQDRRVKDRIGDIQAQEKILDVTNTAIIDLMGEEKASVFDLEPLKKRWSQRK